ncbi:hypothetical protein GTW41_17005 [Streptomyces sp. SID4941]|nr:hypothetical protein [Streptomyces sp. SID4941]
MVTRPPPVCLSPPRAAEGIAGPALGAQFVGRLLDPRTRPYVTRLRAAQEAGEVRADVDPHIALEPLLAPLTHRWLLRNLPLTHAYADRVVDHALRGLSPMP